MHTCYSDILALAAPKLPLWFDEQAVPRFVPFEPGLIANIYADECVLLQIDCQGCTRPFRVAMSSSKTARIMAAAQQHCLKCEGTDVKLPPLLRDLITSNDIHYGDPPNVECCPAGNTMNSVPRRVAEYWHKDKETGYNWERDRGDLEIDVRPGW